MLWEKGQSGNPGGRPATAPLTAALRAEVAKLGRGDKAKAELIAARAVRIALTGKPREAIEAMRFIAAYTDGMPAQRVIFEIEREAERVAARTGIPKDWLVNRAKEIAAARQAEAEVPA